MARQKTLTRSNYQIRLVDNRTAVVFNESHEIEVRVGRSGLGPVVDRSDLVAARESGAANWSDQEIGDVAYAIESRMILST